MKSNQNSKTEIDSTIDFFKREIGYIQANIDTEIGYTRDDFNRENSSLQTDVDKLREMTVGGQIYKNYFDKSIKNISNPPNFFTI